MTSRSPRLTRMVCPTTKDSRREVSNTRHLICGSNERLLVTSMLLTTVDSVLSTLPFGAKRPNRSSSSLKFLSPSSSQSCFCSIGPGFASDSERSFTGISESMLILVNLDSEPIDGRSYPQKRVWDLNRIVVQFNLPIPQHLRFISSE